MNTKLRMPFFQFLKSVLTVSAAEKLTFSLCKIAFCLTVITTLCAEVFGQDLTGDEGGDNTFLYLVLVAGITVVGGGVWMLTKKKERYPKAKTETTIRRTRLRPAAAAANGGERKVDDWIQAGFADNKKRPIEKNGTNGSSKKKIDGFKQNGFGNGNLSNGSSTPNSTFWQLTPPASFKPLPSAAEDELVMDALEQIKEDDDDEMMSSLAIRVLAAAKTREAVEGLTQVALYDQNAKHRIEAVTALTSFDHESVFEPVLLSGADPSREVRAAAARSLSRLSFDRSDAFVRVIGSNDTERLRLAALACVESGFAARAFERLSSTDGKQSYEAFAILTLLVKAGEFRPILQTIAEHPSLQVRLSTVKVLHNLNSSKMSEALRDLSLKEDLPKEVKNALKELLFHSSAAV